MKIAGVRCLPAICGGLILGGCVARVQTISPVATAEHPRVVDLDEVGMINPRIHFIADGTSVAREEHQAYINFAGRYADSITTQKCIVQTPARWVAFWRVVDRLDLTAWRPAYSQNDLPAVRNGDLPFKTDQLQWTMRLSTPGRTLTAKGEGAFPVVGHPSSTTTRYQPASRNGMQMLENAFKELLKP